MSLQSSVLDHKGVNTFQPAAINLSSSPSPVRWGQASLRGGPSRHGSLNSWGPCQSLLSPFLHLVCRILLLGGEGWTQGMVCTHLPPPRGGGWSDIS